MVALTSATVRAWVGAGIAALALGAGLACVPAQAQAQAQATLTEADASPRAWLTKVARAAGQTNYQGTSVVSVAGVVSSTRTVRWVGPGGQTVEHVESLDGARREVFRHQQAVHTLWPDRKLAVIELRESPLEAGPKDSDGAPVASYEVTLEGRERVAGQTTQVIKLAPRDAGRFAQRLWVDVQTGLMLRAEAIDPQGQVLTSTAFSDIKQGPQGPSAEQGQAMLAAMRKLDGYKVVRAVLSRTTLDAHGFRLAVPVTGFRQISCVARPRDAGEGDANQATIVQSIYSDGLVHVSVFVEPHDANRHQAMNASWGATHALSQRVGEHWVTVMGDVPAATIQRFATALERLR
jgi:sigma-E factor negative regulatory protein RseB